MTPPWIVSAWPPVLWQAGCAPDLHFVHLGTSVLAPLHLRGVCAGQTLWGETAAGRAAGVAWDWVELGAGVVALADPFALVTNLRFVNVHGEVIPDREVVLQLNEIVHSLPWQNEVCRALGHTHA
jgi:hypothetical protein